MRVTIKGITQSTIAFNTIGIVVRGDGRNPDLYPESIAYHIDIKNEDQLTEINSLVNAGFIEIIVEEEDAPVQKPAVTSERLSAVQVAEKTKVEEEKVEEEKKVKKGRGRPKGSKNKKTQTETVVEDVADDTVEDVTEENDSVFVMTPAGAREGKMRNSCVGEISDSEKTQASIEAMEKLEKEEKDEVDLGDTVIDESKLDPSEQMGRKAIIASGGKAEEVSMKNSIVPEAEEIRRRSVEFIDQQDEVTEDFAQDSFVDKDNQTDSEIDFLES